MTTLSRTMILAAAMALPVSALTAQGLDMSRYLMPDRGQEIALARSAAPVEISAGAKVLVLGPRGYVEAVAGTNGFVCAVIRDISMPSQDPSTSNVKVRAPHCFNPAAVSTVLRAATKVTEWVLTGVSHAEVVTRAESAYASREFPMPAPGAMAYMQSKSQYLADDHPHWMPHVMFYYEKARFPAASFGAGGMTASVIDGSIGDPKAPTITLLIPVRQWSDGTPDAPHAPEGPAR
jgi:hypothetical protein